MRYTENMKMPLWLKIILYSILALMVVFVIYGAITVYSLIKIGGGF